MTAARPVGAGEFARLMAALGPFEHDPRLAVAISGGRDSLALALLAQDWARRRGGRVTGLTVDHGLRRTAAAEARQVGAWLRARGLEHRILRWRGAKPRANLQAMARAARYRLLIGWCRKAGILHLLLAHQQEDQAETFLLRLGRGSGVDGLAAMAPIVETPSLRLLRPLLTLPRERLAASLRARGQSWIDDPSNLDGSHARVRWRRLLPALAAEGLDAARLAGTAARLGQARAALESAIERLLAAAVALDPAGYAILETVPLRAAPQEVASRALARILQAVGGADYPPRFARLARLYREIMETDFPAARTLGGCRVLRLARRLPDRLLICREPAAVEADARIALGGSLLWDGRFEVSLTRRPARARGPLRIGALGAFKIEPEHRVPAAALPSFPVLFDLAGPLLVPHLSYGRGGQQAGSVDVCRMAWQARRPLAGGAPALALTVV